MFKFRKRLSSQGITWEQLGFQFVIILLGVYLAISFERRVEESARIKDAHEMLGRVLDELRLDEAEILAVTEGSSGIRAALDSVLAILAGGTNHRGDEVHTLLFEPMMVYPTVFPRKAAYSAMVSGGYLTAIPDQRLAVKLANLYEHRYARLVANGELVDQTVRDAYGNFLDYWDLRGHAVITPAAEGVTRIQNCLGNLRDFYCGWYASTLLPESRAEVSALRAELEEYLER